MPRWLRIALLCLALAPPPGAARAETVLRAVLEAEIVTLDPYFSPAYITRTFGYMVFDTLFAPDSRGDFQPQMVGSWAVSDDRLTWRFTLREGLRFHDGAPVTAADVVASLRRWSQRSALGGRLMAVTASLEAADAKTFVLTLREPYGLVIDTLGTTSSPTPFIMPERLARTPAMQAVPEIVGSGPFVYSRADHRTGDRMLLRRNAAYVPRSEPTDFLAGAKVVKVDALEIRVVPDGATAAAALQRGEVDYMQYAPFDLIPAQQRDRNLRVLGFTGPHMFIGHYRFNFVQKPFDDPAIRRVAQMVVDQQEVLDGLGLDRRFSEPCDSFFICGSPFATPNPAAPTDHAIEAARAALRATGYRGEPVVVMAAQDLEAPRVAATIIADRLKRAGFNVDLQAVDWGTLLQRRASRSGWNLYAVHALGLDLQSPLTNSVINFTCQDSPGAGFGCDQRLPPLFAEFARAPTREAQRAVADRIQAVVTAQAMGVPFGQFAQPAAYRANLTGLIPSAIPIFWQVEKK
ncbi:ABC transporter substrate-binding protein [Roseomonas sp. NAR14]|uniref:ABC transporter substrate-binding protein n=1 Tax=Roseomonas acroporae TaxID=2937791 RepID=A0A9X1Y4Y7_9PROT|nr:ABC transporter substrate-binding protein [Roseomonas acroporae]MCK8783160.1 ABC transporter substrate-binding protein [Roseomonas acroporae]